ncbi:MULTISPECIES: FHA domain-containing protein [unclassified Saccharothrix]|uniref:FHA domain-containing protein n=1 Tax=unclassified Saccharothrix TaxID=2593673 RepID=UPI00307E047D
MATCPSGHTSATDDYCDVCGAAITAPPPPATAPTPAPVEAQAEETCAACGAPRVGRFCEDCGHDSLTPIPPAPPAPGPAGSGSAASGPAGSGSVGSGAATLGSAASGPPGSSSVGSGAAGSGAAGSPELSYPGGTMEAGAGGRAAAGSAGGAAQVAAGVERAGVERAGWHVTVEADRAYYDRVVAEGGPDATAVAFPEFCPPRRFDLVGTQVTIGRRSRSRGIFPTVDLVGPPEDAGVSHSHALLVPTGDGWSVVDLGSTNGTTVNDDPKPLRPNTPRPLEAGDRVHVGAWTTITLHRAP